MCPSWNPIIQKDDVPLYLALIKALAADIESGKLSSGFRLPTHRELADSLKIAVGTVTKAYSEAERRGLIFGEGRRGTFVGEKPKARKILAALGNTESAGIDLSKNHPAACFDPEIGAVLRHIARDPSYARLLQYPPPAGLETHRQIGAKWINMLGLKIKADAVFLSGGAQHGLAAILAAELQAGDVVATEEYTYPGIKAIAEMLGLNLVGIAMDREGIIPESLDAACKHKKIRLLYCNPSLQNPTNSIMSENRRKQIAALAEEHDFLIVEDEILSPFLDPKPSYISSIIPDRCYFVVSSSKSVAAGLRVGFIAVPAGSRQRLAETMQALNLGLPPLMGEIFSIWLEDGSVEKIIAARRKELIERQKIAAEILCGQESYGHPSSYHIWLILPEGWTSEKFAIETQMRGVTVASGEIFAAERKPRMNAVRLSLGSTSNRNHLRNGLEIIMDILSGSRRFNSAIV
jgi:DNA-binding transcriptional MocR family regulator